ncbi:MAG: hypothetical protein HYY64_10440, partial [Candidatus Rokubacteria bacterium]|nr:hypothetical protein [Candidatus Rokubacteria bacterium]
MPSTLPGVGPACPAALRENLVDDEVVVKVGYCKGEYTLTMANGAQQRYS